MRIAEGYSERVFGVGGILERQGEGTLWKMEAFGKFLQLRLFASILCRGSFWKVLIESIVSCRQDRCCRGSGLKFLL